MLPSWHLFKFLLHIHILFVVMATLRFLLQRTHGRNNLGMTRHLCQREREKENDPQRIIESHTHTYIHIHAHAHARMHAHMTITFTQNMDTSRREIERRECIPTPVRTQTVNSCPEESSPSNCCYSGDHLRGTAVPMRKKKEARQGDRPVSAKRRYILSFGSWLSFFFLKTKNGGQTSPSSVISLCSKSKVLRVLLDSSMYMQPIIQSSPNPHDWAATPTGGRKSSQQGRKHRHGVRYGGEMQLPPLRETRQVVQSRRDEPLKWRRETLHAMASIRE